MNLDPETRAAIESLPPALRGLLDAELAAGNTIAEVGHGHPAPPVGAYLLLARPVTSRPRISGDDIDFYDRRGSRYSGEFTDAKRHFFILEPPHPSEPEQDMDAIRAGIEARQRAADADRWSQHRAPAAAPEPSRPRPARSAPESGPALVDTFRASMVLDYERWREGTSYDLALLTRATPDERIMIEDMLLSRGVRDWRDVEALAALDTEKARALLRETLLHGSAEFSAAVTRYAPHLVDDEERTRSLVRALEETDFYGGLTQALLQVESFHPPAIIEALLRGVRHRTGGAQVHFAAMLLFLHGRAAAAFDWAQRPYLLRFNSTDPAEREALFRDLCERIGIDAQPFVAE